MQTCRLYQVDAFTRQPFKGNPAGVVLDADGLGDARMQAIARELNNSETAFVLNADAPDHDVRVRFFTPTTEVPVCGHATISAHYVRAVTEDLPTCTVRQRIGIGILPVDIIRQDKDYHIVMTQGQPTVSPALPGDAQKQILAALGLEQADRDDRCPIQIASTGHSKVMVGITDRRKLNALQPDMRRLKAISAEIGSNGFFVFVLSPDDKEVFSHGRMFAPAVGIEEDPVTGNANGPLGGYLVHNRIVGIENGTFNFNGMQGEAMGRPGTISVSVTVKDAKPETVRIGGDAVIIFSTQITVP